MCSEDIPTGLVGVPEPSRRRFLTAAGLAGGAVTAAALTGCTEDVAEELSGGRLTTREAIVHDTYTGLSTREDGLSLRKLMESSDAAVPDNQLRGTHRLVWDIGTTQPYVALSFDDGPDPRWTPQVLDALAEAGAQATFFLMGYNVDKHRELGARIRDEGHDIGNHTWSHQDLAFEPPSSARTEITDGKRAIEEILGVETTYFRPPRGELSGAAMRILAEENYDTFLWSVSRNDPGVGTPEEIAQHIVERLRPGAIVDMHDSIGRGLFLPQDHRIVTTLKAKRDVDVAAVPEILRRGIDAGLQFVTMTQLLDSATNPAGLTPATPELQQLPSGPTATSPRAVV